MSRRVQPESATGRVHFIVHSTEDPLARDGPNVVRNFTLSPKRISSFYLYDQRGTELFEQQCCTPEYYLRRVEARMLCRHAREIIDLCGFIPIVELGAGTAEKTRTLFSEYEKNGMRCDYFPIDVDTESLAAAMYDATAKFPTLFVHCLGTTYERALSMLPSCSGARLFLFLGSTLGNLQLREIDEFLSMLFEHGSRGDFLLIGIDLEKDPALVQSAYNDSAGCGPRSTLNMLHHLNRRYAGNFIVSNFRYRSQYDQGLKRNDIRLESLTHQTVTLAALDFTVAFTAGELIDAEIMWKFDPIDLAARLSRAGFSLVSPWIDPDFRYGLFLLRHQ